MMRLSSFCEDQSLETCQGFFNHLEFENHYATGRLPPVNPNQNPNVHDRLNHSLQRGDRRQMESPNQDTKITRTST